MQSNLVVSSANSTRFKKPGRHSGVIKNYEIRLRGKWMINSLPFPTNEYFICHEEDSTTIGANLTKGKTRKEMKKIMTDLQEVLQRENAQCSAPLVDIEPFMRSNPRFVCIRNSHCDQTVEHSIIKEWFITSDRGKKRCPKPTHAHRIPLVELGKDTKIEEKVLEEKSDSLIEKEIAVKTE
jgi:hypothetical protein